MENIQISLLFFHRMKISMQNCDAYRATKKLELKLFGLEKVDNFVLKNHWTDLTIMVFLEKLRKFKVCGNRFTIVHTDIGKQYEPELDKISRYFNRITLKTDRLKFIFKALNRPGKQDKYSHISAIFSSNEDIYAEL